MTPDRMGSVRGLTRRSFHRIAFTDWGSPTAERAVKYVCMASPEMAEILTILLAPSRAGDGALFVRIFQGVGRVNVYLTAATTRCLSIAAT